MDCVKSPPRVAEIAADTAAAIIWMTLGERASESVPDVDLSRVSVD